MRIHEDRTIYEEASALGHANTRTKRIRSSCAAVDGGWHLSLSRFAQLADWSHRACGRPAARAGPGWRSPSRRCAVPMRSALRSPVRPCGDTRIPEVVALNASLWHMQLLCKGISPGRVPLRENIETVPKQIFSPLASCRLAHIVRPRRVFSSRRRTGRRTSRASAPTVARCRTADFDAQLASAR